MLPETDADGVRARLRGVLGAVDGLVIEHVGSGCARHVTVSLGAVSTTPALDADRHSLIERADRLLYEAKERGRHQAVLDGGSGNAERILPGEEAFRADDGG